MKTRARVHHRKGRAQETSGRHRSSRRNHNIPGSPEEATPPGGIAEEKREGGRAPGAEVGGPEPEAEEDRMVERRTEEPEAKSLATSAER